MSGLDLGVAVAVTAVVAVALYAVCLLSLLLAWLVLEGLIAVGVFVFGVPRSWWRQRRRAASRLGAEQEVGVRHEGAR